MPTETPARTTNPRIWGHPMRPMRARDPRESHRASTPLEVLFDLTFVVAFGVAANEAAHLVAHGSIGPAIAGFAFCMFSVVWPWIGYSWQASGFDNDDTFFRVATFIQMVGVIILTLGVPPMFHAISSGETFHNEIGLIGYVVMRIGTIALWLRIAMNNPDHKKSALVYVKMLIVIQAVWILLGIFAPEMNIFMPLALLLILGELLTPVIAGRKSLGEHGFPWHPHHIAERYGLLIIITLGEVLTGTVVAVNAVVEDHGWTEEAALIMIGGAVLTFGLWWTYFDLPSGEVLAANRKNALQWGYGHIPLFASLVAVGAAIHVAALKISGKADLSDTAVSMIVAVPLFIFIILMVGIIGILTRRFVRFMFYIVISCTIPLVFGVVAVRTGASLGWSIAIMATAPVVAVVTSEIRAWMIRTGRLKFEEFETMFALPQGARSSDSPVLSNSSI